MSSSSRTKHKKWYGVAGEVDEKDEPALEEEGKEEEREDEGAPPAEELGVDKAAFAKDLVLLVINHGIPWKGAELIVKLVNSHVHGRISGEKLPATAYQLKKTTGCRPGNAKLYHVCPECDFVYDDGQTVCLP